MKTTRIDPEAAARQAARAYFRRIDAGASRAQATEAASALIRRRALRNVPPAHRKRLERLYRLGLMAGL